MKKRIHLMHFLTMALAFFVVNGVALAQDDLYFDPDRDASRTKTTTSDYDSDDNYDARRGDNDGYDDESYAYDNDEYAYEYSSRIRRFHRPTAVVDYYDPFFCGSV